MYINKLKKKFITQGFKSLTEEEILEYLLYYLTRKDSAYNQKLSIELLKRYKSIYKLIKTPNYKYIRSNIISEDLFIFLKLIDGLLENKILYKEYSESKPINNSKEASEYLRYIMSHNEREIFKVVYLNTQNEVITEETLFYGTIDKSLVHIREIIKKVIYYNAKSIILSHNHPSGSLKPSTSDKIITKNIQSALKHIDVDVLDHIIVSHKGYYSFLEGGILESF